MSSRERIASLCALLERSLQGGDVSRYSAADASTVLLLAVSSLERGLGDHQLPARAQEEVQTYLAEARSSFPQIDAAAIEAAGDDELRRDLLQVRRLVLDVIAVLRGAGACG
jgi:hypothetical protein